MNFRKINFLKRMIKARKAKDNAASFQSGVHAAYEAAYSDGYDIGRKDGFLSGYSKAIEDFKNKGKFSETVVQAL